MTTAKIMPALFEFLYREFCRARLAEMRKPLLNRPNVGSGGGRGQRR
jgi:hypothetical protein